MTDGIVIYNPATPHPADLPWPPTPRFEIVRFRYDGEPDKVLIARKDTGMVVGGTQGSMAQFGVSADAMVQRTFIDEASAIAWLKAQARLYCGRQDVDFEARDGEPQIVVPRQPMSRVRM